MYKLFGKAFSILFFLFLLTSFDSPDLKNDATQKNVLKTIIIDPGHGLPDPGAPGAYSNESSKALEIALKLGDMLKQNLPNTKILFTRTDEYLPDHLNNKDVANRRRAQFANENHGDLFISIHLNSTSDKIRKDVIGHRKESYYSYSGKGKKRKKVKHTRTVPIYKYTNLGCDAKGTEVYVWAVGKAEDKKKFVGNSEGEMEDSASAADSSDFMFDSPEAKIKASILTKKYFNNSLTVAELVQEEFEKQGRVNRGFYNATTKEYGFYRQRQCPAF